MDLKQIVSIDEGNAAFPNATWDLSEVEQPKWIARIEDTARAFCAAANLDPDLEVIDLDGLPSLWTPLGMCTPVPNSMPRPLWRKFTSMAHEYLEGVDKALREGI